MCASFYVNTTVANENKDPGIKSRLRVYLHTQKKVDQLKH